MQRPKPLAQPMMHQPLTHQSQHLVRATIHFHPAFLQFLVRHVRATIHFQRQAQFRVHHNDQLVHHVQEWLAHVRALFVQDLLHDHQDRVHLQVRDFLHALVVLQQLELHIKVMAQQARQLLAHQLVQVALVHLNVAVLAVRLEKMQAKNRVAKLNRVKHFAMSSTICRHHNLVEQLFRTAMEKLQSVCVAALHWPTSPTRLVQIQQR